MTADALTAHRTWGLAGARPVLSLHCSLAHAGAWAALAAQLNGVALTAIDQPGHGRAADWDGIGDLHGLYTDQAAAMAAHLGQGHAIDILGHSYGATVALRLAMERPDLVRSLVLVEPSLFAAAKGTQAFDAFALAHLPFRELLAAGKTEQAAALFHAEWGAGEALDDLPPALKSYIIDRVPLLEAKNPYLADDKAGLLSPGRLEAINVPVLMVNGRQSPAVAAAIIDALSARLPKVQTLVVKGARHMVPITHAAAIAPSVQAHLDAC